jgi:hypothetical protein
MYDVIIKLWHIPSYIQYTDSFVFDKKFSSLPLNRRGRAPDATIDTKLNKTVHVGANDVNSLLRN